MDLQPKDMLRRQYQCTLDMADSPAPPTPANKTVSPNKDLSPMSLLVHGIYSTRIEEESLVRRLSLNSVCDTPSPLAIYGQKSKRYDCLGAFDASCSRAIDSPSFLLQSAKISSPGSPSRVKKECGPLSPGTFRKREIHMTDYLLKDENSQDSGLEDPASFNFAQPASKPRQDVMSQKSPLMSKLFRSFSSGSESVDDGFLDLLNNDNEDDQVSPSCPSGMMDLLSGTIRRNSPCRLPSVPSNAKRSLIRSLSSNEFNTTPTSRVRQPLFKSPSFDVAHDCMEVATGSAISFKRPIPPSCTDPSKESPCQPPSKKRRPLSPTKPLRENTNSLQTHSNANTQNSLFEYGFQKTQKSPCDKFRRCLSDTDAIIKNSVERSYADSLLIGDFSKPFMLPLMNGKHQDLKTISSQTLAELIQGQFDSENVVFHVIDCRYPYEFAGGHIRGAVNLYSKDLVQERFITKCRLPSASSGQRTILIFHCEFSSERAPSMSRYLRGLDREANKECYPNLFYPEMYLLHGGYEAFFNSYPELCEPRGYTRMLSQGNEADLKFFRAKSRSWAGDLKSIPNTKTMPSKFTLKRLES